jgi:ABC-2 type transport system ATP-binding protein
MQVPAIETRGLSRTFKAGRKIIKALDGVDLKVEEGETFGLLGPNGSGKTTLVKILCTLLFPTSGEAYISGYDVVKEAEKIRGIINMVAGEESSGYGILTIRENIWLFSQLYGIPTNIAMERIDELLKMMDLEERANTKVHKISTGERQKMNLCRGLVTDPEILFLDEPTVGLDVNAARTIRNYVKKWIKENERTVFLTTHNMMEAEEMCDRVAIIDRGRILACDSPANLKKMIKKETVLKLETTLFEKLEFPYKFSLQKDLKKETARLRFLVEDESIIPDIISELSKRGIKIFSLQKSEPTLEDVFVQLVGRGLRE